MRTIRARMAAILTVGLASAAGGIAAEAPTRVACIGDSITQGSGLQPGQSYPSQLQDLLGERWEVKNFGVSGRTLLRKGDRPYWKENALRQAQEYRPDVVVIMLGTNDTKPFNWVHHAEFFSDYRDFVRTFQDLANKPRILACLPCPVPEPGNFGIKEAGVQAQIPLIRKLAEEEKLEVVDIHGALASRPELLPDRVHPNADGARVIAATVHAALTAGKSALTPADTPAPPR